MSELAPLQALYQRHGLDLLFDAQRPFIRSAVRILPQPQQDAALPVGASKFGGWPDLPAGTAWPRREHTRRPLSFLAQFNLAEVHPFDVENKLPCTGQLCFFYDCDWEDGGMPWGFDPKDGDGHRVLYFPGEPSTLTRTAPPEDLAEHGRVFGAAALTFAAQPELPSLESIHTPAIPLTDAQQEEHWALLDELDELEGYCIHKLLGHSNNIQGQMETECEYVTHGLYLGDGSGFQQGRALGLKKNASRWTLLFQLDSAEDDLGMMWGDCGRLYFWTPDEALAAADFSKTWLILQCG